MMNILEIITRKKNNGSLSYDELKFAFMGYLNGDIPDYQMSALLMAITINGMNMSETLSLTDIFIRSGETYDYSDKIDYVVDKHSTGGVGDSTTLIVGPLAASVGLHMAKMSGRGLGITGGTIDKLESIPSFNVLPDQNKFYEQVKNLGFAISAQTPNLVPLDKVIYNLRDVTGTTESIPLIASSIMSKKIAAGASNILIDIKVGSGALIKTRDDAKTLSKWLIAIGEAYHRNVKTIISNMDTPLSCAVGNALEVAEAINVLHGKRCPLFDASVEIVSHLLSMAKAMDLEDALEETVNAIDSGLALKKFYEFVSAQGGELGKLKLAPNIIPVKAKKSGTIDSLDALGAAKLAGKLGASRMTLDDSIDYSVGLILHVGVGDTIEKDDVLMDLYVNGDIPELNNSDFSFINIV